MPHYRATYKGHLEGEYISVEEARKDFEFVIKLSDYPRQIYLMEKYDEAEDAWLPLPARPEDRRPMNSESEKRKTE